MRNVYFKLFLQIELCKRYEYQLRVFSLSDRELRKHVDELSGERDEVIRDLVNVRRVTCDRRIYVTKSCSNRVVYE